MRSACQGLCRDAVCSSALSFSICRRSSSARVSHWLRSRLLEIGEGRPLQQALLQRIDDAARKHGMRHGVPQAQRTARSGSVALRLARHDRGKFLGQHRHAMVPAVGLGIARRSHRDPNSRSSASAIASREPFASPNGTSVPSSVLRHHFGVAADVGRDHRKPQAIASRNTLAQPSLRVASTKTSRRRQRHVQLVRRERAEKRSRSPAARARSRAVQQRAPVAFRARTRRPPDSAGRESAAASAGRHSITR